MPLYYVTGTPGAGKSSVRTELQRRGFTAYETDDVAAFYNKQTGQITTSGKTATERTEAWHKDHEWKLTAEQIEAMRQEADHKVVFLCGAVSNNDEFLDKFDRIFCLVAPAAVIKHRLLSRPDDDSYGKNDHELAVALDWGIKAEERYRALGADIIDAAQPLDKVVDEIINTVKV